MKKILAMSMFALALLPTLSFGAEGFFGYMYRGSYYNTNYSTDIGASACASLKNLDNYDDGVGDVYMQNYMDSHGSWITQCSAQNQRINRGYQIGCSVSSATSYDGRSRGISDSIATGGSYIYSHLW